MEKEETKVVPPTEDKVEELEEEVVEIEDVDLGLNENHVKKVRELNKKKVVEQHVLNKQQQKTLAKIMAEAKMPVKMTDEEFTLGDNELDIRKLSSSNRMQMLFRTALLDNVYGRQILDTLVDILRLLMVIADKIGVDNIVESTDEVTEKVEKQNKIKEQLSKAKGNA